MRPVTTFALALLALAQPIALVQPAQSQSRIMCEGNFQIVYDRPLSTPYCREQNLAQVARAYGIPVSAEAIRRSESVKGDVCRTIGYDNRVREVCSPYRYDGGDRFRF